MSTTTKRAFASSLKNKLQTKPLEKITVTDICEDCEVNRQTFYYHFKDIYDLVEWIYTVDADKAMDGKKTYQTWEEGFLHLFEYALKEKSFVIRTYHSISREHLENFLFEETYHLLMGVINEMSTSISIHEADKAFIADFYKYAFVGLLLDWVRKGMIENPEELIKRLAILLEGSFAQALERSTYSS